MKPAFLISIGSIIFGACTALQPGTGDDGGDDGGGDDGVDPADAPCTTGSLFAGNPLYAGTDRPSPSGTPLRADPPLAWRDVVKVGSRIYTHEGQEIWAGDSTSIRRLVGERQPGLAQFRAGSCASARLAYTDGIAVLPDGSLVVADFNANALVKITDPAGPSCAVAYYAGTGTEQASVSQGSPPNLGNVDGTGAAAKFSLPLKPVSDPQGNVYVLDHGNMSIRKVAPGGVVTTVPFAFDGDVAQWNDLALRGSAPRASSSKSIPRPAPTARSSRAAATRSRPPTPASSSPPSRPTASACSSPAPAGYGRSTTAATRSTPPAATRPASCSTIRSTATIRPRPTTPSISLSSRSATRSRRSS
jgi:hypothetical protein